MKISKETLDIIKNFSLINPAIKFQKGNTLITASDGGDLIAKAVLQETFPLQFLIEDLSSFCATISLLKDPDVDFEDTHCVISSGRKKIKYFYSDPRVVRTIKNVKEDFEYFGSFDISKTELAELVKLAAATSTVELGFKISENEVECKCYDPEQAVPTTAEVSFPIKSYTKDFELSIPISTMNFIKKDYEVRIAEIVVCFYSESLSYIVRSTYRR